MTDNDEPIPLEAQHVKQACAVLARAFHDDPMMQYLIADDARRARLLPSFFGIAVRYCLRYGEGFTTSDVEGVACWLPPGDTIPTFGRLLRVAMHGAPLGFGWSGLRRYSVAEDYIDAIHKRLMPGAHWYLWVLGVELACQGQGIGSLLMQPALARTDAQGLPCYLETENAVNVAFYEKRGFRVANEALVPGCGIRSWAMIREPRG